MQQRGDGSEAPRLTRPVFDDAALARAEEAMHAFSDEFPRWLQEDIANLARARDLAKAAGMEDRELSAVHDLAQHLEGVGETYGSPLITAIASSLVRLLESPAGRAAARRSPELLDAHVDGARAAYRDAITSVVDGPGRALLVLLSHRLDALDLDPRG